MGSKYILYIFFFVNHIVGTTRNLQCLWMFRYKCIDVTNSFLFQDFIDGNQDARLFHITKAIVDGGAEELHGRTKPHIGIHQWRYVVTQLANLTIQNAIIGLDPP